MANNFTMRIDPRGLDRAAQRTRRDTEEMVRKIAERLFENIVRRTPVDTGWARANWVPSINEIDARSPGERPPDGETVPEPNPGAIAAVVQQGKIGDVFWLTNAVPYIRALEYGHSKQAPAGMVRVSIAEVQTFYRQYGKGRST